MRYAFLGTPDFAAIILERLIEAGMSPATLITNPDRPAGHKRIITPPPTKILAGRYGIKIWQPEKPSTADWQKEVGEVDLAIVAAYAKILPPEILSLPKKGVVVVHPSLLPRHRGATPIQTAILSGDEVTGTTLIVADEKIDHGPIVAGRELAIEKNDTYLTLMKKLAALSADLLIKNIPAWLAEKIKSRPQNENYATYTKKFQTEDGFVDLEKDDPELVLRKVRALNPEPGVWTFITLDNYLLIRVNKKMVGRRMKILDAEIENGVLKLKRIQAEGEKSKNI